MSRPDSGDPKEAPEESLGRLRHDLNNPLTAISGSAELLLMKEKGLSEEGKRRLRAILDACARMTQRLSGGPKP